MNDIRRTVFDEELSFAEKLDMIGVKTTGSHANAKRQWYSFVSQRYGKQCPTNAVTDPQFTSLGSSVICLPGVDQNDGRD